jgi:hypothetical protein
MLQHQHRQAPHVPRPSRTRDVQELDSELSLVPAMMKELMDERGGATVAIEQVNYER